MIAQLKRLLSNPVFIVLFAFLARMAILDLYVGRSAHAGEILRPLWL